MSLSEIAVLRAHVAAEPRIRQAILFGSVASGRARADSDLDIALDLGHPLTAADRIELIEALAARSGRPIDLVDLRSAGEPLLGQILQHGQRLKGSDEDYARLLVRHLLDEADFMPLQRRILAERRRAWIGQ